MNTVSTFCHSAQVSIIGAGNVGSTLAQRIAERNLADVVLLDVVEGRPQGVALDLMQARSAEHHDRRIIGTNNYADTAQSDVIVITAGVPRKPGMTRENLIETNARIVAETSRSAIAHSPHANLIVITNPLDVMTYVAWQITGLPNHRVMGMAGVLDSARFQTFIALELGVPTSDVTALVLGDHGDLMVPLPQYSTVSGIPITELLDSETITQLIDRTRNGGGEIVQLLKQGSAYYAPASSAAVMVEAILQNQSRILPTAAYLQGEYGLKDVFLGVPCRVGCQGVQQILELRLADAEQAALQHSAQVVKAGIDHAMTTLQLQPSSRVIGRI